RAVLAFLLLEQGRVFVDLVVGIRGWERLFDLFYELADGLVRLRGQDEDLAQGDCDGDNKVGDEELAVAKGALGLLVKDAVEEKQSARRVKGTRQKSQDQARVSRKGVGQLE